MNTVEERGAANEKENRRMDPEIDLEAVCAHIAELKRSALELSALGEAVPCLARNTARILASLKMLEIGFSEVLDLDAGR
jgi:hypothetical protein